MEPNRVALSWEQIEALTRRLAKQIDEAKQEYDVLLGIARGGMFPCLLLAQVLKHGMTLTCHLQRYESGRTDSQAMPRIIAFPTREQLAGKKVLIVDEVWDYGDSIIRVRQEAETMEPMFVHTAVLHFKPARNRYPMARPTYFVEETADWIDYRWEVFGEEYRQSVQVA